MLSAVITVHDLISVHLVHVRAKNPIAIVPDAPTSAYLVVPYCNNYHNTPISAHQRRMIHLVYFSTL